MAQEEAKGARAGTPTARLVDSAGQEWKLSKEVITCGRAPDNDLILESESVSRRHARFELGPEGYDIADLGSRNGTRVNDEPLPAGEFRALHDGDRLAVGDH